MSLRSERNDTKMIILFSVLKKTDPLLSANIPTSLNDSFHYDSIRLSWKDGEILSPQLKRLKPSKQLYWSPTKQTCLNEKSYSLRGVELVGQLIFDNSPNDAVAEPRVAGLA